MDHSANSARVFDQLADGYREKFMDLTLYDDSYREFCELLPPGRARVLDAACGPGNVARYLMAQRPELDLLGLDLAPRMVEQVAVLLEEIAKRGISILLVEQKLTIALKISKRLYVMGHGQIVFEGTPAELDANTSVRQEWLEV